MPKTTTKAKARKSRRRDPEGDFTITFTLNVEAFGHDDAVERFRAVKVVTDALDTAFGDAFNLIDADGTVWRYSRDENGPVADPKEKSKQ